MADPVPKSLFEEPWLKGNFLIPADPLTRRELYHQLVGYARCGIMYLPQHKEALKVLKARIAALEAYDEVLRA